MEVMAIFWTLVLIGAMLGAWRTIRATDRALERWRAISEAQRIVDVAPEAANDILQPHGFKVVRMWVANRHLHVIRRAHELPPPRPFTAQAKIETWV